MEFVKVIIVGGGVAGLSAAKILDSKVDYILVEAQDYLGGRICTVDAVDNVVVDLGAQFIHGETNNIVYEICKQLNCILIDEIDLNDAMLVLTPNQITIHSDLMIKAIHVWEAFLEHAIKKFEDHTLPCNYSFLEYLHENFKKSLKSSLKNTSEDILDSLVDYFEKSELIENGCLSLKDLSLKAYGSFEYLSGNYDAEFQNGGYRPFINHLKTFITNAKELCFKSEVIRVKFLRENQRLQVDIRNTSDQSIRSISCEHMIWTSSLGYLKENFSSIFADEIELIKQKTNAIENLGFDTVNKIILVYEKSFWPKEKYEIILLNTIKERLCDAFEKYNHDPDIRKIIQGIHRYDVLSSTTVPVLICWFGGEAAMLIENYSKQLLGELCHDVLCYYLNISSQTDQPIRVLRSAWHKNRFIRGSYSYYSTKSTIKDGDELRKPYAPDGIPRILFAGEATHEKFFSTVHGAFESGIREGNRLLSLIENKQN